MSSSWRPASVCSRYAAAAWGGRRFESSPRSPPGPGRPWTHLASDAPTTWASVPHSPSLLSDSPSSLWWAPSSTQNIPSNIRLIAYIRKISNSVWVCLWGGGGGDLSTGPFNKETICSVHYHLWPLSYPQASDALDGLFHVGLLECLDVDVPL